MRVLTYIFSLFVLGVAVAMNWSTLSYAQANMEKLDHYLDNPAVCAFLDTIAYAEGTFTKNAYRLLFGFDIFDGYDDHPRRVVCVPFKGSQLCSSAAGRYQFSRVTWDKVVSLLNIEDFSPINQDRAAVYLLLESRAVSQLEHGRFRDALACVKNIWASMPGSPYGQPTRRASDLADFYVQRLEYHKNRLSNKKRGRLWKGNTRRVVSAT